MFRFAANKSMRPLRSSFINALLFSAIASAQTEIYVEQKQSVEVFKDQMIRGAVSRSSDRIAMTSNGRTLKVYMAHPLAELWAQSNLVGQIAALQFSPDGRLLVTAMADGLVIVWGSEKGSGVSSFRPHSTSILAVGLVEDKLIVTAGLDRTVRVTATSGKSVSSLDVPKKQDITSQAIDPQGSITAIGTASGQILLHTLPQLTPLKVLGSGQVRVTALSFSSDGKYLAAGTGSGQLQIWDVPLGKLVANVDVHKGAIACLDVDPKSRWVATTSTDSTLKIVSLVSHSIVKNLKATNEDFSFVGFVNDEMMVSGSTKGNLKAWRVLETPPDTIPPTITLTRPSAADAEPVKVFATEYGIEGIASDNNDVKEVQVNGVSVPLQAVSDQSAGAPKKGGTTRQFATKVTLETVGINAVSIKAIDAAGNSAEQLVPIRRLSNEQALEVMSPTNNEETDKVSIQLKMKPWFEVASYAITANLLDVVDMKDVKKGIGEVITEEIPLVMGYNQIQLVITSKSKQKFTRMLGVTRKVLGVIPSPPPTASKERMPGPQRWAVVVGISEYLNPAIPSLKFADHDAEGIAEFLQRLEGGGYDNDHMRVLLNKEATLANLREALINFLSQAIDQDLVFIYFAGHGAPDPARPTNTYLLTYDTDPTKLGTTAFPMWQIQDVLARYITARKIVVFSDACHSGAISVNFAARGLSTTESNLINQYLADLSRSKEGIVVFTASAAGEVSQEFSDLGHGVFTYYLLQGLEGKADYNNDYTVTINELMQYVEEQVKRKTQGAQNPTRSQTTYDKDLTMSLIPH